MKGFFRTKTHFSPKMIANPDGSNVNYLLLQQQHMHMKWNIDEETQFPCLTILSVILGTM
ncbi:hypothetical protein [Ekhidna sp.]|jgi:hypothetical protein|uniref:hypothetical protein n=1 Tax=Ekhidna sp. TaxID=2608089 RepID=UPI0032EDDFFE